MTELTDRFDQAFLYASRIHGGHKRKGTGIPYLSHLMSVAALTLEHGGNEDQAIAALLHDAAEDCGGQERLDDVRARKEGAKLWQRFNKPAAETLWYYDRLVFLFERRRPGVLSAELQRAVNEMHRFGE